VDSGRLKEAQVQPYSPGGDNVPDDTAVICTKMAQPIDLPLGSRLWWDEGSTSSIVFASWRQCALVGGHIDPTWRLRLNRPPAVAMRPYDKLV